ncbi:hypothetical protein ACW95P_03395 [Candidatus Mycoplasma pogonae]
MISEKNFNDVIENLKKYKLEKTKLGKLKFEDIYLNLDDLPFETNAEKFYFSEKLDLFNFYDTPYEVCWNDGETPYENFNSEYPTNIFFENYMYDDDSKKFDSEYDLYILKNEHFGYDSSKIEFLELGKKEFLKYPIFEMNNYKGFKQTFILVKNTPNNGKAEFYVKHSNYCEIVYGETPKTKTFINKIEGIIKEIFGWPIINYRFFEKNSYDIGRYSLSDGETSFEKFIKKNDLQEIDYSFILNNYSIYPSEYIEWKNLVLDYPEMNIYNPLITGIRNQEGNLMKDISEIKLYFLNESKNYPLTKKNHEYYNFWKDSDVPYLKFFKLDEDFLNVKHLQQKFNPSKHDFSYEFHFAYKTELQQLAFEKNIIFTKNIIWPILVWDQRNFRKPFYKFIFPLSINNFYNKNDSKKFFEKALQKIKEVNNYFELFWTIFNE